MTSALGGQAGLVRSPTPRAMGQPPSPAGHAPTALVCHADGACLQFALPWRPISNWPLSCSAGGSLDAAHDCAVAGTGPDGAWLPLPWLDYLPASCWQCHGTVSEPRAGCDQVGFKPTMYKHPKPPNPPPPPQMVFLNTENRYCPIPVLGQDDHSEEPAVTTQGHQPLRLSSSHPPAWDSFPACPRPPLMALAFS